MSQDIRSYFTSLSKKSVSSKINAAKIETNTKKRSISDDDIIPVTPENKKQKKSDKKSQQMRQRIVTLSSDSETENDHKKILPKANNIHKKLEIKQKQTVVNKDLNTHKINKRRVNPLDAFGSKPVVQDKIPKKVNSELNIHEDDDFDKTLIELDEDDLLRQSDNNTSKEKLNLSISSDDIKNNKNTPVKNTRKNKLEEQVSQKITPKKNIQSTPKSSEKTPSQKKKRNEDENESTMDPDQERYEKKRYNAMQYQKYLNRNGPSHPGSKWIPKIKSNCLQGLSFVITGILDSLDRDEAQDLIVEYGGRCLKSISGKVNYMVLGEDAGPMKIEKARKLGTKIISEDDLIELICTKAGIQNENTVKSKNDKPLVSNENKVIEKSKTVKTPEKMKREIISSDEEDKVVKKIKLMEKVKSPVKMKKEAISSDEVDELKEKAKIVEKVKTPVKNKKNTISSDDDEIPAETVKSLYKKKNSQEKMKTEIKKSEKMEKKAENKIDTVALAWVDKYKPTDITQVIGQQGERSNLHKLLKWLQNWHKNLKTSHSKPSPWAKDYDGAFFKAVLLSGPPGVGKTTTATLVCKHLGWDTVEFNASDTRNKRMIHAEVSQILKTTSLAGYVTEGTAPTKQHVLLMDEVDGMSGNEDRGGIQELIGLIKTTNIPIICMCNDRQHPKIRNLANYCFDLRFAKPRLEQIRGAMMSVCFKENVSLKPDVISQIIKSTDQDIRQTLNQLSLMVADNTIDLEKTTKSAQKDIKLGPWEVVRKVFSADEHKNMSFIDHSKLFFYDYSIGPLFVQENYLKVVPQCPKNKQLERFAQAADAISMGDVIDARIRSTQNWSLLDVQAMYASVLPGFYLRGHFGGQIDFPSWLGKNSRTNKLQRLINEVYGHIRLNTTCDRTSICLDLANALRNAVTGPLLEKGTDGLSDSMNAMSSYSLMREDLNSLCELCQWPNMKDPFEQINSKVKAAFTRAYNKEMLPYAAMNSTVVKKRTAAVDDQYDDNDDEVESEEEKDDINTDGMIKMKKPAASKTTAALSKASSSKGKTSSRGGTRRGKKEK